MNTEAELESLTSRELHDQAVRRAVRHADVTFLWQLLRAIPAAQALEGDERESKADAVQVSALLSDAIGSGNSGLADALRPLYIDYLSRHPHP